MLRALYAGRASAGRLGAAAARPLSMRAEPSSAVPATSELQRISNSIPPRRRYHQSAPLPKSADGVHVSFESGGSSSDAAKSEPAKGGGDGSAASGSACSQGIPNVIDDEEEEQEEMFVTADPVLGHGNRQEWGGPRRGGRLAEPTRFGDWERKGRCTDF